MPRSSQRKAPLVQNLALRHSYNVDFTIVKSACIPSVFLGFLHTMAIFCKMMEHMTVQADEDVFTHLTPFLRNYQVFFAGICESPN